MIVEKLFDPKHYITFKNFNEYKVVKKWDTINHLETSQNERVSYKGILGNAFDSLILSIISIIDEEDQRK